MGMPGNFGFGDEEQMLRDAARKLFASRLPTERLHRLVAADTDPNRLAPAPWDPALWAEMAELGWAGIAVPERAGGSGMSWVAAVALAEEAGRAALPAPLVPTLQACQLLAACATAGADEALAEIAAGAAATLAITARSGAWSGDDCGVRARDRVLEGRASYVQDAAKAGLFVVRAVDASGSGLYLVRAGSEGLSCEADAIVDLTRDQAHLEFSGVRAAAVLAPPGEADAAIRAAEPALFTAVAADLCGAAEWQLQTTAEYARVREQFGRPLGFFQAVKHPLVDAMIQIDQARSHLYNAACAIDHAPDKAVIAAHMAKAAASDAAAFVSSRSVQFHGGIGFTWECFVQLYFKRQTHNRVLFGDAAWHRARLAELLLPPGR